MLKHTYNFVPILIAGITGAASSCQKTTTAPSVSGVAAFTVVNAIPNSQPIIPVFNTSLPIIWFGNAYSIGYGSFYEYSPIGGIDTVYMVQDDIDTLNIGPKAAGQMFYDVLDLKKGGIYSLFLCGADTTAPDYLLTIDTLLYYAPGDSSVGIRFVNLSAGSNPISVNLEGSPNGSEVGSLSYKGITGFKDYLSNASAGNSGYQFVFRDATTGDSLSYMLLQNNSRSPGLTDNNGIQLTFKNVTIAFIGQPGVNALVSQSAILVDDY